MIKSADMLKNSFIDEVNKLCLFVLKGEKALMATSKGEPHDKHVEQNRMLLTIKPHLQMDYKCKTFSTKSNNPGSITKSSR
jgi:hypothetical protein